MLQYCFEDGPWARECRCRVEAEKGKETESVLDLQRLQRQPYNCFQTSGLRKYKKINMCGFKPHVCVDLLQEQRKLMAQISWAVANLELKKSCGCVQWVPEGWSLIFWLASTAQWVREKHRARKKNWSCNFFVFSFDTDSFFNLDKLVEISVHHRERLATLRKWWLFIC